MLLKKKVNSFWISSESVQIKAQNCCTLTHKIPECTWYAPVNIHTPINETISLHSTYLWTDPASFIFIWCSVHVIQATDPFTQHGFANRIDAVRTVHNTNCRLLPIGWAGRWARLICPEWAENSGCLKSVMIFLVHRCMVKARKRVWVFSPDPEQNPYLLSARCYPWVHSFSSIWVGRSPIWIWVVDIWRSASVAGVLWTWDTRWP